MSDEAKTDTAKSTGTSMKILRMIYCLKPKSPQTLSGGESDLKRPASGDQKKRAGPDQNGPARFFWFLFIF